MAVLTSIDESDAREMIEASGLEGLRELVGLAAGSVNSNFALLTEDGRRFFLRLYEERDLAGAERETAMLDRLAFAGVPTPAPVRRRDGSFVAVVRGRPAALFPWRDGQMRCQASVTPSDARQVGEALARVHLVACHEPVEQGRFGFPDLLRRLEFVERSERSAFASLAPRLRDCLVRADSARDPGLPRGLTHGDLFRDNVLWTGGGLSALLDFESACEGTYTYDLMVTVLSWCFAGDFEPALAQAMCAGYEAVRPLERAEENALLAEASFAALRFTITRITDYAMRVSDRPRSIKDWRRFEERFTKLQEMGLEGVKRLLGVG